MSYHPTAVPVLQSDLLASTDGFAIFCLSTYFLKKFFMFVQDYPFFYAVLYHRKNANMQKKIYLLLKKIKKRKIILALDKIRYFATLNNSYNYKSKSLIQS